MNQTTTEQPVLSLSDFDFDLPESLIAQHPLSVRSASKLLQVSDQTLSDRQFSDLPNLVGPNDLIVFNDTEVIKARLFGAKETGGKIEVLIERVLPPTEAFTQIRASHGPQIGSTICLENALHAEVIGKQNDLYHLRFDGIDDLFAALTQYGHLPLPPYIERAATPDDESRYQTIFAQHPGAVAAPTAGLHFDEATLEKLDQLGVRRCAITLHVGAGTFQPVRHDDLSHHTMHSERYRLSPDTVAAVRETRERGGKIIAVGTTTLRALESAATEYGFQPGVYETRIFIRPGYRFQVVDRLITNFHLPKTTLLILVSAFAGRERMLSAYDHAVRQHYRFFSYGDAMLLEKAHAI